MRWNQRFALGVLLTLVVGAFILVWAIREQGADGGSRPVLREARDATSAEAERMEPVLGGDARSAWFSSQSSPPGLRVKVTNREGAPIEGALVSVRAPEDSSSPDNEPRTTDESGRVAFLQQLPVGSWLSAQKESHSTEKVEYEGQAEVEIILHDGWDVSGVVSWSSDGPVADARVLAIPAGRALSQTDVELIGLGVQGGAWLDSRSQDDGSFTVSGLRRDEAYTLTAISPGCVCTEMPVARESSPSGVVVQMVAVYALLVEVRDEAGEPPKTSSRVFGQGQSWSVLDAEADTLHHRSAWLSLAGAEWLRSAPMNSSHDALLLFTTDEPRERVEGVEFSVHVPGYLPIATVLDVPRLGEDPQRVTLLAQSTSRAWGAIEVAVSAETLHPLQPGESTRNLGTLFLHGVDTTDLSVRVNQTESGTELFQGVPSGVYEARFRARNTPFHDPPLDQEPLSVVVRGDGPPASVRVDPGGAGTFVLELSEPDGQPYDRAVTFLLEGVNHPIGGARSYVHLERAPYIIDLVRPGDYVIRVQSLAAGFTPGQEELLLPAIAGETISTELRVLRGS